jgi:hypothetical protein
LCSGGNGDDDGKGKGGTDKGSNDDDSKVSVALARVTATTRTREGIMVSVAMMTAVERRVRIGDNDDEKDSLTHVLSLALQVHSIVRWWQWRRRRQG